VEAWHGGVGVETLNRHIVAVPRKRASRGERLFFLASSSPNARFFFKFEGRGLGLHFQTASNAASSFAESPPRTFLLFPSSCGRDELLGFSQSEDLPEIDP